MNQNKLFIDINKSMVDLFGNKLRKIILYGSYAQNAQNKDSDIDFFVLVDDTEENLRNSKYRMDKANDDLDTSGIMFKNNKYSQSINRSYYAMFHAVRSLLALSNFDSQKTSGIISYFNYHYIKSGKIEVEYSKMLATAFKIRRDSNYKDFYVIT